MKLLRQRLVNFIGIEHGIGVRDIEIDYASCPYRKILFLGMNGAGKTVIQSTATPFRETFDNRSGDLILPGMVGIKEVDYQKGKFIYKIVHIYSNDSKGNKSFITKHPVDDPDGEGTNLNKSGIQKGFLEAVKNELGVTPDFIKLVKLGSRTASIIDLNSTDRKKFIGNFIPNVNEYLSSYKNATKNYNNLNRDIKVIARELDNLGDENDLNTRLQFLTAQSKQIQKSITTLSVSLEKKNNILSEVPSIREKLNDIIDEIDAIQPRINVLIKKRDQIDERMNNGLSKRDFNLEAMKDLFKTASQNLSKHAEDISSLEKDVAVHESAMLSISSDIKNNDATIRKIRSNLLGFESEEVSTLTASIDKLEEQVKTLIELIEKDSNLELDAEMSDSDVSVLLNDLKRQVMYFADVRNNLSESTIDLLLDGESTSTLIKKINKDITSKRADIRNIKEEINEYREQREKVKSVFVEYKEVIKHLDECTCGDGCGLVDHIKANANIEARKTKLDEIDIKIKELEAKALKAEEILEANEELLLDEITNLENINSSKSISEIVEYLGKEDPELSSLKSCSDLISILNTPKQQELLGLIKRIETFNKNKSTLSISQTKILRYREQLRTLQATNDEIEFYDKQNIALKTKYEDLRNSEKYLKDKEEIATLKKRVEIVTRSKEALEEIIEICSKIESLEAEVKSLEKDAAPLQKTIDGLQSDIEESEVIKKDLLENEENLKNLQSELVDTKLDIARINEYNEKLESIKSDLELVALVREATDIKTGIPLVLVGSYLEPIKKRTNELLDMVYHGNFNIDFDISDTEFNIPVFKNGVASASDILIGSQGETSNAKIALSMGLVDRTCSLAKNTYNIVYLDELDAELDHRSREAFLTLLDRQLDSLGCEQCFIITHNDFFDSEPAGLVLLKGNTVDLEDEMFMHNKHIVYKV